MASGSHFPPRICRHYFLSRNVGLYDSSEWMLERNACLCSNHSDRTAVDPARMTVIFNGMLSHRIVAQARPQTARVAECGRRRATPNRHCRIASGLRGTSTSYAKRHRAEAASSAILRASCEFAPRNKQGTVFHCTNRRRTFDRLCLWLAGELDLQKVNTQGHADSSKQNRPASKAGFSRLMARPQMSHVRGRLAGRVRQNSYPIADSEV
jgi:hypothetical protein